MLDKSALYIAATHGVIRLERKYISGWEDGRREIYDINESGENYTYSDNTSQFSTIAGNAT